MEDLNRASILEMAMGAIEERVNYEMDRVIQNILDRNTQATGKRKVVVELTIVPDDDRKVLAEAKAELAAEREITEAPPAPVTPCEQSERLAEQAPLGCGG